MQFIGCAVFAGRFEESERAVGVEKDPRKEIGCVGCFLLSPSPEAGAADFGSCARKAFYRSFGMDLRRRCDRCVDLHPVTDKRHTAERYARLGHAPRAGIHTEPKHLAGLLGSKARQVG